MPASIFGPDPTERLYSRSANGSPEGRRVPRIAQLPLADRRVEHLPDSQRRGYLTKYPVTSKIAWVVRPAGAA